MAFCADTSTGTEGTIGCPSLSSSSSLSNANASASASANFSAVGSLPASSRTRSSSSSAAIDISKYSEIEDKDRASERDILPGNGHVFGNFNNYYSFHPPADRTSLFPRGFFKRVWQSANRPPILHLLDIGCNEGHLTLAMMKLAAEELGSDFGVHINILGVDIDRTLITKANNNLTNFWDENPSIRDFCHATFVQCDVLRDLHGNFAEIC